MNTGRLTLNVESATLNTFLVDQKISQFEVKKKAKMPMNFRFLGLNPPMMSLPIMHLENWGYFVTSDCPLCTQAHTLRLPFSPPLQIFLV